MSFVVYPICGNIGYLELVDGSYTARKAIEYMQCCKCGEIVKVVLDLMTMLFKKLHHVQIRQLGILCWRKILQSAESCNRGGGMDER